MRTINATLEGSAGRDVESWSPMGLRWAARFQFTDGTLSVRDAAMRIANSVVVPAPPESQLLFATEDLTTMVTEGSTGMIIWRSGVPVPVDAPGAIVVIALGPEHLLAVAPAFEVRQWLGRDEGEGDAFDQGALLLLDAATGAILDTDAPMLHEGTVSAMPHPHDGSVVLEVENGQDGSWIYRARIVDSRLWVEEILRDVVPVDFSPSGDRLLVMPLFGNGPTGAAVLSWPDLDRLASMNTPDPRLAGAFFDHYGCFLGEDRLVLKTNNPDRLLVCRDDLSEPAWVQAPTSDEEDVEFMIGLSSETVLVRMWQDRESVAHIWRIPA